MTVFENSGDVLTQSGELVSVRAIVDQAVSEAAENGGSSAPVSCILKASNSGLNIKAPGVYPFLWDDLWDNAWDEDSLDAIPAGLGLDFVFDGTVGTITTTEAGTWIMACVPVFPADDTWRGSVESGELVAAYIPYADGQNSRLPVGAPFQLPAGATFNWSITTAVAATADPYTPGFTYLFVTRIG